MASMKWMAALGIGALFSMATMGLMSQAAAQEKGHEGHGVHKAEAQLIPTTKNDSKVKGIIFFEKTDKGMHIHGEVTGLTPGEHGFHVHQYGVWSEDGKAAGGHFNPHKVDHAGHGSAKRHVGDLGNIKADEHGKAVIDIEDSQLTFEGPNCILGRGLVVHEKADDLKSQPSGNAGSRVAVAIIGVAK